MLSREDNELLTRTDRGTPMGEFLRRFWIPCMLVAEIPPADEAPKRLRLLGEDLVVFRDTSGRVGVMDEYCPHRLTSLYFGRNEENGIRCVYHGWKFDVEGNCVDMPSEPPDSNFRRKVKAVAYPAVTRGGLLWVYMGPKESPAAVPELEWLDLPADQLYASRWEQDCNSIQAMEGELDGAHVSFLHRRIDQLDEAKNALTGSYFMEDMSPAWTITDKPYGFVAANRRNVEEDKSYWRFNQFLLPFYTMIAAREGFPRMTRMWVPKDDEHCWVIAVNFRPDQPLREAELAAWKNGDNTHRKVFPGTTQPTENKGNEYNIDRNLQKKVSFTGIAGIRAQDAMATESPGPIVDRTKEHLAISDTAIIAMRKRLIGEARALQAGGPAPRPASEGGLYRVRSHQTLLQRGKGYEDEKEVLEALKA